MCQYCVQMVWEMSVCLRGPRTHSHHACACAGPTPERRAASATDVCGPWSGGRKPKAKVPAGLASPEAPPRGATRGRPRPRPASLCPHASPRLFSRGCWAHPRALHVTLTTSLKTPRMVAFCGHGVSTASHGTEGFTACSRSNADTHRL